MKKTAFMKVSLMLLCLALMLCAFVACDKSGSDDTETGAQTSAVTSAQTSAETSADTKAETSAEASSDVDNGITQTQWNAMINISKFDNVTFTNNATFISGYNDKGPHINVFKLNGSNGIADGEPMQGESLTAIRTMFLETAIAIVNDFGKFEYNATDDSYVATENIVYPVSIMGYDATITAKNVVVKLDDNMNIASISCNMTQEFEESGTAKVYVLDIIFTFTDYGTTVLA